MRFACPSGKALLHNRIPGTSLGSIRWSPPLQVSKLCELQTFAQSLATRFGKHRKQMTEQVFPSRETITESHYFILILGNKNASAIPSRGDQLMGWDSFTAPHGQLEFDKCVQVHRSVCLTDRYHNGEFCCVSEPTCCLSSLLIAYSNKALHDLD